MVVNLLKDTYGFWHASMFMTEQERADDDIPSDGEPVAHSDFFANMIGQSEATMFAQSLEASRRDAALVEQARIRTDIGPADDTVHAPSERRPVAGIWLDEEFDRLSNWIVKLRVVEGDEREKHWPPPSVKNPDQLLAHSRKKPKVGWLNIGSDPLQLRRDALGLLSAYFFRELEKKASDRTLPECFDEFLETWSEIFGNGTFRLGMTHVQDIGVANGAQCRNMVYDFDPSNKQFHCFPVLEFPPVSADFHEGQIDF